MTDLLPTKVFLLFCLPLDNPHASFTGNNEVLLSISMTNICIIIVVLTCYNLFRSRADVLAYGLSITGLRLLFNFFGLKNIFLYLHLSLYCTNEWMNLNPKWFQTKWRSYLFSVMCVKKRMLQQHIAIASGRKKPLTSFHLPRGHEWQMCKSWGLIPSSCCLRGRKTHRCTHF